MGRHERHPLQEAPHEQGRALALPTLHTAPGHLIRVAQQVHTVLWRRELRGAVTSVQYACLLTVADDPLLDQQTLGVRASLDKASVADLVKRLVNMGLLERSSTAVDRRRRLLTLTVHGEQLWRQHLAAVLRVQESILAPLAAHQRPELLTSLAKIAPPQQRDRDPRLTQDLTLHSAAGHLIRRAQQRHWGLWDDTVGAEVTSVQYGVLLALYGAEPVSQNILSASVSLDKNSVADVVARLERRNLVRRTPHAHDRRRQLVTNTEAGAAVVRDCAPLVLEVQDALFAPLDAVERQGFRQSMSLVCRTGASATSTANVDDAHRHGEKRQAQTMA